MPIMHACRCFPFLLSMMGTTVNATEIPKMSTRGDLQTNFSHKITLFEVISGFSRLRAQKGNEYYSREKAKFLGKDGAATNDCFLIDETLFNKIKAENNNNTTSEPATTQLLSEHKTRIIEDTGRIQANLQAVQDSSIKFKIEYQMYIYVDRITGVLSSAMGKPGDNSNTDVLFKPSANKELDYIDSNVSPLTKILIGQVHGHPEAARQDSVSKPGRLSPKDSIVAVKLQIAIYSVDAMNGDIGERESINRIGPDGEKLPSIGYTRGRPEEKNKIFCIGMDALKIWANGKIKPNTS